MSAVGSSGLSGVPGGYVQSAMKSPSSASELRIPADPQYIVVAKRAAAGFAYIAGFGVEAMDELGIAIAQACENAIRCVQGTGQGPGQLRISFQLEDQRLTVQVASSCAKSSVTAEPAGETEEQIRASKEAAEAMAKVREARRRAAEHRATERVTAEQATADLALRVMGLFVDDCRYRLDERTGGLRVRLTKYRVS